MTDCWQRFLWIFRSPPLLTHHLSFITHPSSFLSYSDALQEVVDDTGGVFAAVRRTHYMSDFIWTGTVIYRDGRNSYTLSYYKTLSWTRAQKQTWFKLYPHTSIILNLLDHLTTSANHNAHRVTWNGHLSNQNETVTLVSKCKQFKTTESNSHLDSSTTTAASTHSRAVLVSVEARMIPLSQNLLHHFTCLLERNKRQNLSIKI